MTGAMTRTALLILILAPPAVTLVAATITDLPEPTQPNPADRSHVAEWFGETVDNDGAAR